MGSRETGSFIAQKRKEKNWSQKDLAAVLHVTDKAVSRWERGVGYPDVTLLKPLADALNVSVSEIMEGRHLSEAEGNTIHAQEAVEHSLAFYMAASMDERRPLREMIRIQRIWVHVTVPFVILFVIVMKGVVMPSASVEILCGYIFGFAMFAGILIQERVWNLAGQYQVFAPEEYQYEDIEQEKDYGDYPRVGAAPAYLGLGKAAVFIFARNNGREMKLLSIFFGACKVGTLVSGFLSMFFGMYTVANDEERFILFFFPYVMSATGLFLDGGYKCLKNKKNVDEADAGKKQIKLGLALLGGGILLFVVLILLSLIYWRIFVPWRAGRL